MRKALVHSRRAHQPLWPMLWERVLILRAKEGLKKVTIDHLLVARWIKEGILPPEALYTHAHMYQLERALYTLPQVEVDLFTVPLQPGDVVLLCSDGLWREVRDSEIEDVISYTPLDPSQAAEALIQAALDGGGLDNVSVIVVSMSEMEDRALVPGVQLFARPDSVHIPHE